ncbi:hypothetical protein PR202_ga11367 [Eleusine coracana subsp. coracana]|uniref:RRM domain-containing protein n=1 Tax=Eleusine coracana subsp. coracana TaxID=191504 RepID=A0AAV5C985_ELECO|nr:hypothetical protein PR202_ga11367 [Eleusine coracana subsp. coracana]
MRTCKMSRYDDRYDRYDDRYDRYDDRYDRYDDRYDRYDDRYDRSGRHGTNTKLYVGQLSSRTQIKDLDDLFSKYGRVKHVDLKRDFGFVEFSDPRDADDARCDLDGRKFDGSRIIVEFARGMGTGLVTVKLVTGKIGAITVEKVVILEETAGTVLKISSEGEATRDLHLLVVERTEPGIMAGVAVGVMVMMILRGLLSRKSVVRSLSPTKDNRGAGHKEQLPRSYSGSPRSPSLRARTAHNNGSYPGGSPRRGDSRRSLSPNH